MRLPPVIRLVTRSNHNPYHNPNPNPETSIPSRVAATSVPSAAPILPRSPRDAISPRLCCACVRSFVLSHGLTLTRTLTLTLTPKLRYHRVSLPPACRAPPLYGRVALRSEERRVGNAPASGYSSCHTI